MQAVESGSPRHDSRPGGRTRNWASKGSGITFAVMVVVLLVATARAETGLVDLGNTGVVERLAMQVAAIEAGAPALMALEAEAF